MNDRQAFCPTESGLQTHFPLPAKSLSRLTNLGSFNLTPQVLFRKVANCRKKWQKVAQKATSDGGRGRGFVIGGGNRLNKGGVSVYTVIRVHRSLCFRERPHCTWMPRGGLPCLQGIGTSCSRSARVASRSPDTQTDVFCCSLGVLGSLSEKKFVPFQLLHATGSGFF